MTLPERLDEIAGKLLATKDYSTFAHAIYQAAIELRSVKQPEAVYTMADLEMFTQRAALAAIEHCQPAVDALRAFVKAEESFLASVKPGVVDDHLTDAYKQAKEALAEMDERESRLPQIKPEGSKK